MAPFKTNKAGLAKLVSYGKTRPCFKAEYFLDPARSDFFSVENVIFVYSPKESAWTIYVIPGKGKVVVAGKEASLRVILKDFDTIETTNFQWVFKLHNSPVSKTQWQSFGTDELRKAVIKAKVEGEDAETAKIVRKFSKRERLAREKALWEEETKKILEEEMKAVSLRFKARLNFVKRERTQPPHYDLNPLSKVSFSIGRKPDRNHCVIADPLVAKKHAIILFNRDKMKWSVINMAWFNKVRVNGKSMKFLETEDISHGDKISILGYQWSFEVLAATGAKNRGDGDKRSAAQDHGERDKLAEELKTKSDQIARLNEVIQAQQKQHQNVISRCSSELKCPICDEMFVEPVSLGCGHVFCDFCVNQWKAACEGDFTCPTCREKVEATSKSIYLKNLVDAFYEDADALAKAEREQLMYERKN